jgi:hypothetical protein
MSGKVLTEGDKITKADTARQLFNLDGSGTKIGIISTSFDAQKQLQNDIVNGELPSGNNPVKILKDLVPGSNGADDEGRALAQILHDISPGAEILFHTAAGESNLVDDKSYSEAVNTLVDAGANVIVDDIVFPTSILQNGSAALTVRNAVGKGVIFVSAAGNNGKISYQSNYQSSGTTFDFGGKTFEALDLDPSTNIDIFQDIIATKDRTNLLPLLTWSEPNGNVRNDLEMFLVNSPDLPTERGDNLLAISAVPTATATDYPLKGLGYQASNNQKMYLVIGRELNGAQAPDRVKWVSNANGSDRTAKYEYINSNDLETGSSTIFGVPNLNEVITVGAADPNQDFTSEKAMVRSYSSEGSSPILFNDVGDPLLNPQGTTKSDRIARYGIANSEYAGDPLLNPQGRVKPDIIAPDGISTSVAGFETFPGTSAAAPGIAGIVALMQQAAGGADVLTPQQIKEILQNTSVPVNLASGMSNPFPGVGLPQADLAVAQAQAISGNIGYDNGLHDLGVWL